MIPQANAGGDVEARAVKWALDRAASDPAFAESRIGMTAPVDQGYYPIVVPRDENGRTI